MSRWLLLPFVTVLALAPLGAASGEMNEKVLEFHAMVGVAAPFLGAANPLAGVPGGGLPWVLSRAEGELKSDGDLHIQVRGLIVPASVPGFGFNPAPFFLAVVSCATGASNGQPTFTTVMTTMQETRMIGDPRNGDAVIRAKVNLPHPCFAPVVFVTSPAGAWFAATGVQ